MTKLIAWAVCLPLVWAAVAAEPREEYRLGAQDVIAIRAVGAPEIVSEGLRIDPAGEIRLPMIGSLTAEGLTAKELEAAIVERLARYVRDPQVVVIVQELASRPVAVLGAVRRPGVQQLGGGKTLAELLSAAGGLTLEAGPWVQITRRKRSGSLPLPGAELDETGGFWKARVDVETLLEGSGAAQNIAMLPEDVVSVPNADQIYVLGAVKRAGGFALKEREQLSVLQAIALAGGLAPHSAPKKALLLAPDGTGSFRETAVDLKGIMAGVLPDIPLRKEEVLFVPINGAKVVGAIVAHAAVTIGTGAAIWAAVR